jgi:flagellum-specific peptidoglycan hydrolase FlgJ
MNVFFKHLIGFLVGAFIGAACVLWDQQIQKQCSEIHGEVASIKWRQNHFILSEENLVSELKAQGVEFPEIVVAQALLETGNFKSYACINRNNLFGLRKKDSTYMSFEHWTECVAAYKKFIQKYKQPPDDYYKYLKDLGYAEDPDYIVKLKQIVNKK